MARWPKNSWGNVSGGGWPPIAGVGIAGIPRGAGSCVGPHLWRDLAVMIARGGPSQAIGEALQAQARQMFSWWHRGRNGTLAHASFARYRRPMRREVERLLDVGQTCGSPKPAGVCRELLKRPPALWTFVWGCSGARAALGPTAWRVPGVWKR
jgi:hypothetical protein